MWVGEVRVGWRWGLIKTSMEEGLEYYECAVEAEEGISQKLAMHEGRGRCADRSMMELKIKWEGKMVKEAKLSNLK